MKIENIKDSEYTSRGDFTFTTKQGEVIEANTQDVLEIAYALFDWAGMSYEVLDEINEKVEN